jgi:hypothetical protein
MDKASNLKISAHYFKEYCRTALKEKPGVIGKFLRAHDADHNNGRRPFSIHGLVVGALGGALGAVGAVSGGAIAIATGALVGVAMYNVGHFLFDKIVFDVALIYPGAIRKLNEDVRNGTLPARYSAEMAAAPAPQARQSGWKLSKISLKSLFAACAGNKASQRPEAAPKPRAAGADTVKPVGIVP